MALFIRTLINGGEKTAAGSEDAAGKRETMEGKRNAEADPAKREKVSRGRVVWRVKRPRSSTLGEEENRSLFQD